MPVDAAFQDLKLSGFVAKRDALFGSKAHCLFFVNGRPIESRLFTGILWESYANLRDRNHYPTAFLFLKIPPNEIDVNIHPMKKEIRFRDERSIRQFLLKHIVDTITPSLSDNYKKDAYPTTTLKTVSFHTSPPPNFPCYTPTFGSFSTPLMASTQIQACHLDSFQTKAHLILKEKPPRPDWTFLSVYKQKIALFQTEQGLTLFHCQLAQKRILYEKAIQSLRAANKIPSQALLVPISIEVDAAKVLILKDQLNLLNQCGFDCEYFGGNTFRFYGLPQGLLFSEIQSKINDISEIFSKRDQTSELVDLESVVKWFYDRFSVAITALNEAICWDLVDAWLCCSEPYTSPDGLPILHELSDGDILKKFS